MYKKQDTVSRFTLRVWGARGSFPTSGSRFLKYGGHTACVSITRDNEATIILDAGTGIRELGSKLIADTPTRNDSSAVTEHLLITHRHADHVIGLPHFYPLHEGNHHILLRCGNANRIEALESLSKLWSPPLFPSLPVAAKNVDVSDFEFNKPTALFDDVVVHSLQARHPGGASIFVIADSNGAAVAYAPDNELSYHQSDLDIVRWRSSLVSALQGVPLLIHDAMYLESELSEHVGWGHSSAEEATRFAIECNAGTLILFHHHPDREDSEIDAMVSDCSKLVQLSGSSLRVIAAYEGMTTATESRSPHHLESLG